MADLFGPFPLEPRNRACYTSNPFTGTNPCESDHPLHFAETLQRLVELQTTDSGLDELERLKKGFQKDINTFEGEVAVLKTRIQEGKKALEDLAKARKTFEIEVGSIDQKIKKYQSQESEVKSNEQFTALKHEVEKGKEDKAKAEEKVLECLIQEDEQKLKNQELAKLLETAEKKAAADKKVLQDKIDDCDKAAQGKRELRTKQFAEVPPDFAASYEGLRTHGKKIAVAEISEESICGGCKMQVPPQMLNEIKKNIAIQRCDCGRFLYVKT